MTSLGDQTVAVLAVPDCGKPATMAAIMMEHFCLAGEAFAGLLLIQEPGQQLDTLAFPDAADEFCIGHLGGAVKALLQTALRMGHVRGALTAELLTAVEAMTARDLLEALVLTMCAHEQSGALAHV